MNLEIENRTWDLQGPVRAHPRLVSVRYFETLGMPLKRGRPLSDRDHADAPLVAVINTWSEINPCHSHFRARAEEVKRGIWQAGGFPVEMPAISLSEPFQKPTTMLYRNFLAMETEELLRSYPADGAVLMAGCDKTTPALIMGAISMGLPAILVPAGPMLRGDWGGNRKPPRPVIISMPTSSVRTRRMYCRPRHARVTHNTWRSVRGAGISSYNSVHPRASLSRRRLPKSPHLQRCESFWRVFSRRWFCAMQFRHSGWS